jgi:hypothetical protein
MNSARRRPAGWRGGVPPPEGTETVPGQPPRRRRAPGFLLLLLALAIPCHAEERFLIERIDVRHLEHASADVIRAESRLREGERYDESELRDANNRIKRLPFVLDATFKLERGSVRDAYVLVIAVSESKPFFYLFDATFFRKSNQTLAVDTENAALLGARWFTGRHDVFHLAAVAHRDDRPFESAYSSLQGGYTRYGLLGDRAFATLTIDHYLGARHARLVPGALLGISLGPKKTLTISYTAYDVGDRQRRSARILEARFAHNTTNHPFFPSEGTLLSVAPVVASTDTTFAVQPPIHTSDAGVDGHAARYWPIGARISGAAIADGGMIRVVQRGAPSHLARYGSATLRLSGVIGDPNAADVQERFELSLRGVSRQRDYQPFFRDASNQLSAAWVRRNAWGVIRLGVGYAW